MLDLVGGFSELKSIENTKDSVDKSNGDWTEAESGAITMVGAREKVGMGATGVAKVAQRVKS